MYFKGIIKNNETNFLACRIIGFVALIFLFFSCRCLCACVRVCATQLQHNAPAALLTLRTDVIAKSSFPLSGFFIVFIHFSSPPGPFYRRPTITRRPSTRENAAISFYARRPGYHSGIIATNKIVKFRQIYAVHYFLLLCPSRL